MFQRNPKISASITPLTGGLAWAVKFSKTGKFTGGKALAEQKEMGIEKRVVFFRMDDRRIARQGTIVLDGDGREVGKVLSGTLSPMINQPIGSALVPTAMAKPGSELYVDIRGKLLPIQVAKPPLHK